MSSLSTHLYPCRFSLSRRRGPSLALRQQCLSPETERSSNHDYLPLVRTLSPSHPAVLPLCHPGNAWQHQQQHTVH